MFGAGVFSIVAQLISLWLLVVVVLVSSQYVRSDEDRLEGLDFAWPWPGGKNRSHYDPNAVIADFGPDFLFGLATAPAHVEDDLHDVWLEWGLEDMIPFFLDQPQPVRRLDFWSNPEAEIQLAANTGVKIFRMGLDWGRLAPHMPGSANCNTADGYITPNSTITPATLMYACRDGIQDRESLEHYVKTLELVRQHGMRVMLTLFHHSLPKWANDREYAGWTNPDVVDRFLAFAHDVVSRVAALVDMYAIFNEPAVYASLVYSVNMWPGRLSDKIDGWAFFDVGVIKGAVIKCFENMALAHNRGYDMIKELDLVVADKSSTRHDSQAVFQLVHEKSWNDSPAIITIAHNVAEYDAAPPTLITKPIAHFLDHMMNYKFLDMVIDKLDLIGINYYGKEYISTKGSALLRKAEYSMSGRAVSPIGFFDALVRVNARYNIARNRSIPIMITENGVSDSTDLLRPSYLIEHLMAVDKAIKSGVPVVGYIFWTISDNFEWADGYCPKFGMVEVDRSSPTLKRTLRPSYHLFSDVVTSKQILARHRVDSWSLVRTARGKKRQFCRDKDGKETTRQMNWRRFSRVDWRLPFGLDIFPH